MILIRLAEADAYAGLHRGIADGLAWIRAFDPTTPDGRYEVDGENVWALVSSYDTAPGTEKRFESHRLHLDLQVVIRGTERILHTRSEGLEVEVPYDEANDIVFYAEPKVSSSLLMREGDLAMFHPGDAHKPGCMAGARHDVRKVVVKIRL